MFKLFHPHSPLQEDAYDPEKLYFFRKFTVQSIIEKPKHHYFRSNETSDVDVGAFTHGRSAK